MTKDLVRAGETPQSALQRLLTSHQSAIQAVLPANIKVQRLIRIAVTALTQNKYLQDCSMVSICNSVMLSAQLGLEPNNGLGHAYLIPYNKVCTFQPGYRGLIALALRSGKCRKVEAEVVREKDHFEYEKGTNERLIHRPYLRDEAGDWYGVYAYLLLTDGTMKTCYMSRAEVLAVRDKSSRASSPDSPWIKWEEEMAKKTALKRLLKTAELSVDTAEAVGLDDQAEGFASKDQEEKPANRREIVQDLVLEAEFREDAEVATDALTGTPEKQTALKAEIDERAQAKLAEIKRPRREATAPLPSWPVDEGSAS